MTPEAQRIAIAEACGWKRWKSKSGKIYLRRVSESQGDYYRDCGDGVTTDEITQSLTGVPDYLNDLNAMHEAEKGLTNAQRRFYSEMLIAVHPLNYDPAQPGNDDRYMRLFMIASMTAAQRAKAFLKTIGKWITPST